MMKERESSDDDYFFLRRVIAVGLVIPFFLLPLAYSGGNPRIENYLVTIGVLGYACKCTQWVKLPIIFFFTIATQAFVLTVFIGLSEENFLEAFGGNNSALVRDTLEIAGAKFSTSPSPPSDAVSDADSRHQQNQESTTSSSSPSSSVAPSSSAPPVLKHEGEVEVHRSPFDELETAKLNLVPPTRATSATAMCVRISTPGWRY